MKYENVGIKTSKGVFYLSQKEKSDEYNVEFEKDDKKYYHKEFNTLDGKLTGIKLRDGKYGKQVSLFFEKAEDVIYVLNLNVFNQGSRVDDWMRAFTLYLANLKIGEQTEISLNRNKVDKKGYLFKNAFVKQNGIKVDWAFNPMKDAPKWEQTTDKVTGEAMWDSSNQDKFYYDKIKESVKQEVVPTEEKKTTTKKPVKAKAIETKEEDFDDEKLPF